MTHYYFSKGKLYEIDRMPPDMINRDWRSEGPTEQDYEAFNVYLSTLQPIPSSGFTEEGVYPEDRIEWKVCKCNRPGYGGWKCVESCGKEKVAILKEDNGLNLPNDLKVAYLPSLDSPEPTAGENRDFFNEAQEVKKAFIRQVNSQQWHNRLRTTSESLIIMFDQMVDRLRQPTPLPKTAGDAAMTPQSIVDENFKGLDDAIGNSELSEWYKRLIVTCLEGYGSHCVIQYKSEPTFGEGGKPIYTHQPPPKTDEEAAEKWRSYTVTELLYAIIGACEFTYCGESKGDAIYRIKEYAKQALKLPDARVSNDDDEGESIRYSNEKQGSSTDVYIFSKMSVKQAFLAGCQHVRGQQQSDTDYQLQRLYDWVTADNLKPSITAFTSGPLRNVAREIEYKLKSQQGDAVAFAEWIKEERYEVFNERWSRWEENHWGHEYTTSDLYALFTSRPGNLQQTTDHEGQKGGGC